MKLYLVRHGHANEKIVDPERHLSRSGKEEVRNTTFIAAQKYKFEVDMICHSGKARAEETAEILADTINYSGEIEKVTSLHPLDDPGIWAEKIKTYDQNLMLVGHSPYMGKMASLLVTGSENDEIIYFPTAGIACLNQNSDGKWVIEWFSGSDKF
ncbi:phosphohistidine phosphatase SixA [candidate division KSB1 bacterium]